MINDLFKQMFGDDFLLYSYCKEHGTSVDEKVASSLLEYSHEHWELQYAKVLSSDVDWEGDSPHDESNSYCSPGVKVETEHVHVKKDTLEDSVSSEDALCEGSSGSLSDDLLVIGPISPDVNEKKEDSKSILHDAMAKAKTRAEVAALFSLLPPVSTKCSSTTALSPFFGSPSDLHDPCDLNERPCESLVKKAQELLDSEKKDGRNPSGIKITGIGQFSEQGLIILKQFCTIADTKHKVSSEANWLAELKCSSADLGRLQDALWHHPGNSLILRFGKKSIDVMSFSDLAEERYVDSFIIDISIGKYIEEARANGNNDTIYFPTEVYQWMKSSNATFKQTKVAKETSRFTNFDSLKQILVPVHMPNHWGLVVVDMANMNIYFDDGLTSVVPPTVLPAIKELLHMLAEMHPSHPTLQTQFWKHCNNFNRFGMPSQAPVDSRMIGTGSCGIGVIMAAKDFLKKGSSCIRNFQWRYCDMDLHRKDLMLQILNWSV